MRIIIITFLFFFFLTLKPDLYAVNYLRVLEEGDLYYKIEAMHRLGYSKNKKVFWYLIKYLSYEPKYNANDPNRLNKLAIRARAVAAKSLGKLGDKRAVPYLVKRYSQEKSEIVKRQIVFSLGFFKNNVSEFKDILKVALKSESSEIRFEAILSISEIGDASFAPDMTQIVQTEKDEALRAAAGFALVQMKSADESNIKILTDSLASDKPIVRYWSAYFLGKTTRYDAINSLLNALEIENQFWIRKEMERTLMILKDIRGEYLDEYSFIDEDSRKEAAEKVSGK